MATVKEFASKAFKALLGSNFLNGNLFVQNTQGLLKIISSSAPNKSEIHSRNTADSGYQFLRFDASNHTFLISGTSTLTIGSALLSLSGNTFVISTARTPASATATGTTGSVCWDADYIYICVAANTWKRSAIATW